MAKPEKRFLRALQGQITTPAPFWFMRQAGRYLPEYRSLRTQAASFLEFCYTPDLAVEATLQPLRRFSPDAAILFSDILVIPDALGQQVSFQEGRGPVLVPLRRSADLKVLDPGRVNDLLAPVFETVRRLAREIPSGTTLIGFAGAPWTVATYMVEGRGGTRFEKTLAWEAEDPAGFGRLMDILVDVTAGYLLEQVRNGAEALQLFDTWAGALDKPRFRKLSIKPTRAIVERVKAEFPDIPILGFPRGAGPLYAEYVQQTGVDGVGLDSSVDLAWAAEELQGRCTVQGNLDPQLLVAGGVEMRVRTEHILEKLADGPFVFNLGHGIVPETPAGNVEELAQLIKDWRKL